MEVRIFVAWEIPYPLFIKESYEVIISFMNWRVRAISATNLYLRVNHIYVNPEDIKVPDNGPWNHNFMGVKLTVSMKYGIKLQTFF
ncbi:hypothetical protein POTOM_001614 [Populus tomentosa]|uniref:Uncharacterized protein n=1 Tax=Populus tomentosa TaxID=118781 RepID=A0A8X8DI69_POPTO|nr:hypothetical protein POTOM_001614 [Populus tomentosa]